MSVMNDLLAFYADMKEAMEYDESVEAIEEVVEEKTDDSRPKAA